MVEIRIISGENVYLPIVAGDVVWTTQREGSPGKLNFKVVKDSIINFQEGNVVELYFSETPIFLGYVFQKKRDKGDTIEVTAYDQLRYLKNKDTYVFENEKASDFIKALCGDFNLKTGNISDTQYVIPYSIQDNKTLFDMIQDTLDTTLIHTKKMFVLYDDFGKITLKNIEEMRLPLVFGEASMENFDYTSSIDSNTYNQIKITYDNEETGTREIFMARDSNNISNWGILQHYEASNSNLGLENRVDTLLSLYNKKTRRLSLKNVYGENRVRAGSGIMVNLNLGDIEVFNWFICEAVTHNFKEGGHFMDITLIGDEFG